jgi:hypothetical protein
MSVLSIAGTGTFRLIRPLVGFKAELEAQLRRFPFEKNVFLMMKYRESNAALSRFMIEILEQHGLRGVRADDPEWDITRTIYNPLAVLYCCKYGIALFDEAESHQAYSPNVAYELGIMHYQGKDCLILRHASLPAPPFDLIKDLHRPYGRDLEVREAIRGWVERIAKSGGGEGIPEEAEGQSAPDEPRLHALRSNRLPVDVIVLTTENTDAWGADLVILGRHGNYLRLSWKLTIQNRSRGGAKYRIKVVFKNQDGHTLDDQEVLTPAIWQPMQQREFSDRFLLSPELADALAGAAMYVALVHE